MRVPLAQPLLPVELHSQPGLDSAPHYYQRPDARLRFTHSRSPTLQQQRSSGPPSSRPKAARYFDKDQSPLRDIWCAFCLEKGHSSGACHTAQLCYKCGEKGHYSRECNARGSNCSSCKRVGHKQKDCGRLVMSTRKKGAPPPSDAECMVCGELGHLRCGAVLPDEVYQQAEARRQQQRERQKDQRERRLHWANSFARGWK